jgi:hypothetical protein
MLSKQSSRQLIDELEEAYIDWRVQSHRVWVAYGTWSNAVATDGRLRFAAYLEELDREQRACELYAQMIASVADRL